MIVPIIISATGAFFFLAKIGLVKTYTGLILTHAMLVTVTMRQMWSGIREQISPTTLAVATILVAISILMLTTIELLWRRSERLRGVAPA